MISQLPLDKTMPVLPRRAHLQFLLAECYDELGMKALANVCREKARQAESQSLVLRG